MKRGPLIVIGDTLLDVDITGVAERLSPEAPVPVVDRRHERHRAGGAGLAATLAAGMTGGDIVLITALGDDNGGRRLHALLEPYGELLPLPLRGDTPRKMRIRVGGHPLMRLDTGDGELAAVPDGSALAAVLGDAGAVLVSDYGRGITRSPAIRELLANLPGRTPVVWDPHPKGGPPLPRVQVTTPNRTEARILAPAAARGGDGSLNDIARDAAALVRHWGVGHVAVTLGDQGALLSTGDRVPFLIPAPWLDEPTPTDTCGAGDCFAAAATHVLHGGGSIKEAVIEAVQRATAFVASRGAAYRSGGGAEPRRHDDPRSPWRLLERIRERRGRVVATGGCFDLLHAGHVNLLREARRLGDCLVVCLNSDASVRALKGPDHPLVPVDDRACVLSALECVDAVVVFDALTPVALLDRLRPDIWVKGADYAGSDLVEAGVVRRHGGEVVLLPCLDGRSTSLLLERARRTAGAGGMP